MGRFVMYTTLLALALFVLGATFVLKHGGGATVAVADVSVQELSSAPERFQGHVLTTEGTLSFSGEHDAYQVSDERGVAVLIRNYSGSEDLGALSSKPVRVTGRFDFDGKDGLYIDADVIRPIE